MTHFFGAFFNRDFPAEKRLGFCNSMAAAFAADTFVLLPATARGRLNVGFAIPRRFQDRIKRETVFHLNGDLTIFGDVTLYNRDAVSCGAAWPDRHAKPDVELVPEFLRRNGDLARLNGDFAFGIYDETRDRLTLVRDQVGGRILYYVRMPHGLLFSTRLDTFFHAGLDGSDVDAKALASYLVMRSPGKGLTYFRGINELPPAHLICCGTKGDAVARRYWSLEPHPDLTIRRPTDWVEHIRSRFVDAVTSRLADAEKPAIKLSGGLDSSAVAGAMCARFPETEIAGFAHIRSDRAFLGADPDEACRRAIVRRWDNLRLFPVTSGHADPLCGPGYWNSIASGPCIDPFFFAETALSDAIYEQNVDIVLSGYGGDHCISAYSHPVLIEMIRGLNWRSAMAEITRLKQQRNLTIPDILVGRILARIVPAGIRNVRKAILGRPWHAGYAVSAGLLSDRRFCDNLREDGFQALANAPLSMKSLYQQNISAEMSHFIAFENRFNGINGYLSRRPMLDIDLLQSIVSAPAHLTVDHDRDRALIRRISQGVVPDSVLNRQDKAPFVPDYPERLVARAGYLAGKLTEFEDIAAWRHIVDKAKVSMAANRLKSFTSMSDTRFVEVMHLVLIPYFAGCFLEKRAASRFVKRECLQSH